MKKILIPGFIALLFGSCGNNTYTTPQVDESATEEKTVDPHYDPEIGSGRHSMLELPAVIDEKIADAGKSIYESKCVSCHKLSEQKMAAPGWKNLTRRHSPAWIMNFLTNTDEMLDKDPELQAQLDLFKIRMPDQNLTDAEARAVLEFMRKNDSQ